MSERTTSAPMLATNCCSSAVHDVAAQPGPRASDHGNRLHPVSEDLATEVDCHGSPVSVPAAEWFMCFVPGLQKQWWHRFANRRHQHVFAIRALEDGSWLLVESWWTRMLVSVLTLDEALKFLRWGATGDVLQVREAIPGRGNQLRGWSNCAVMMAFMLGRGYRTWTPHGLYRRLVAEQGVRAIDLGQWLANHIRVIATRDAEHELEKFEPGEDLPLRSALLGLGDAIMRGLTSRSALALHRASISESAPFRAAAAAYWKYGLPQRAMEAVRKALEQARMRGETDVEDAGLAAWQFIAMLRGDIHPQLLFGVRRYPEGAEIRSRVRSVVDLFLSGAASDRFSASELVRRRRVPVVSQVDGTRQLGECLELSGDPDQRKSA